MYAPSTERWRTDPSAPAIAGWLLVCAVMVAAMMLIGAVTRLTESGLSMVEWRPLVGILPPLSAAEWERIFGLYRQTSEYRLENSGMRIDEFQTIFWWEYIHRLWGRLIGLVFGSPLLWFAVRRRIPSGLGRHLVILFLLGGLQGVVGWWMVKSGFVDRHDVSQYRLALHLGMAFLILGYILWLTLSLSTEARPAAAPRLRRLATGLLTVISVTLVTGALVAGLGAGFDYTTWPLMDGALVPDGLYATTPMWVAAFEDVLTVQFDHRILAYTTLVAAIAFWLIVRRSDADPVRRRAARAVLGAAILQTALGISTLLSVVAIQVAVAHQAGAILLFSCAVWARHAFR